MKQIAKITELSIPAALGTTWALNSQSIRIGNGEWDNGSFALQGNDTPSQNRLTITVRVRFYNKFDESLNFDQSFSRYADYNSSLNLSSVEATLVAEITDALTDDIFNKAFVNW